ncbi:efflux RND transporter periplasmic adaptor subunit [Campylobacter sp. RM13119]|uniref:efflux RND transporter periplasmic adaptor subunit n=1 Tax=Campylobacter californiensis TaxID=1032243 RepID=UPI00147628A0|nr:efflux RND transporter periplasmic adaptor subunit [Campylobacter sp. RM13119]MBE3606619.1 efflux RND transporter periplasmic adaptor subunit [Campylobacter sp. RM13119]
MRRYGALAITLVVMMTFTGCDLLKAFNKKEEGKAAASAMQKPPAKVDVVVAKKGDFPMTFNYPARIQSEQDVVITPKVAGTLLKQNFKAGDSVKEGQILFVIDPDLYTAAYEVAQANILQAQATLKNAKSDMDRIKKLFEQKATSQKDYDSAVAALESATANLASAQANAKTAKLNLEYSNVKAPFSGVVGENLVDIGTYVAVGSTQLVRLTKINPIEARFYISDIDNLNRIKNLNSASWEQLNAEAVLNLNNENYVGRVKFIDATVDTSTGNVLAKAEFENKDGKLLPGMFARIQMDGFIQKNSFTIPQVAILQDTVSPYVYLVKDGKVAKQNIKIIYQTVTEAYVSDGINEGDVIITNNFKKIGVGAPVVPETQGKENK